MHEFLGLQSLFKNKRSFPIRVPQHSDFQQFAFPIIPYSVCCSSGGGLLAIPLKHGLDCVQKCRLLLFWWRLLAVLLQHDIDCVQQFVAYQRCF